MIRHKVIAENENFISFRKSSEVKFPWVVGPFIIESKSAIPVVDSLLKGMYFKTNFAVNYDPLHVISTRREVNTNKPFEHREVEGLAEKTNWSDYPKPMENAEVPQENSLEMVKSTEVIATLSNITEAATKITFLEDMET